MGGRHFPRALAATGLLGATIFWAQVAAAGTDLRIICRDCEVPEQCGDHTDLCLVYPGEGNFCGMHCLTDEDCAGLSCQNTAEPGLRQCVDVVGYCRGGPMFECSSPGHCQPGQLCEEGLCVDDVRSLGESCADDAQCLSGLCDDTPSGRRCTQSCDAHQPVGADCPEGFYCARGDGCDDGRCAPGEPGAFALGEACEASIDCESLFCIRAPGEEPACHSPCAPPEGTCDEGTHCVEASGGCGLCVADCTDDQCAAGEICFGGRCQEPLPDGSPCDDALQCQNLICHDGLCGAASPGDADVPSSTDDAGQSGSESYSGQCGCAVPGGDRSRRRLASLLVPGLLVLVALRRRRRR